MMNQNFHRHSQRVFAWPTITAVLYSTAWLLVAATIPLPEHPRPDFERSQWLNLNGKWQLRFDQQNTGEKEQWFQGAATTATTIIFPETITVPFPWGSPLSGVSNTADIAWYARSIRIPAAWHGQRIFLIVGACDWQTKAWLDGQSIGQHRGGYTPFEFELTSAALFDQEQRLVLRVDDTPHPFKLEGKQGYGPARGIWQTVYLEARPQSYIDTVRFVPDIHASKVVVSVAFNEPVSSQTSLKLHFKTGEVPDFVSQLDQNATGTVCTVSIPKMRLWSLDDPFLYEVEVTISDGAKRQDKVSTYFGMRKISVMPLPGSDFPYIALNDRPLYLQMALDQSYHPEGFYTFPSDDFMRDEILRSRRISLNALRLHVKIDVPRKLYWADRLGLLLMADVPNSWGAPDAEMRLESETALRGMIRRDFNHPAIFSWVLFNETWGLSTKNRGYTPETQDWVANMVRLAKQLDATRLVEDNSACNYDHVLTDINSWHTYLPGYRWREQLDQVTQDTHPGSKWNFIGGRTQAQQPLLNSECGNVWGYEGSTGDVDWSWDYHLMMNEFRRHPKICGWLYTEHHDVINEWNGYYRFDRSEKYTGLSALVPGMTLRDLHGPFYLSTGSELCRDVRPGETVEVPLWASFMTDRAPAPILTLRATMEIWDRFGAVRTELPFTTNIAFKPWLSAALTPLQMPIPKQPSLVVLHLNLEDSAGAVLHRNFTTFLVSNGPTPRDETVSTDGTTQRVIRFAPTAFQASQWSLKQWQVLDGLKVNGAGYGYFEYRIPWPEGLDADKITSASFTTEVSAKQLFGKDRKGSSKPEGDFMRGQGTHDPSLNPNAYPMTDTVKFPSAVRVRIAGQAAGVVDLPDDPADHRGILSWHAQKRDRFLREAGSYGYLLHVTIPESAWRQAAATKEIVLRLEVDESLPGGLAIYGERFGRYPCDPTLTFTLKR